MKTGTYSVATSGVNVPLQLSVTSATVIQMTHWDWLWARLLSGGTTTPSTPEHGGDDAQGGRP
jgi:hypothetical protein